MSPLLEHDDPSQFLSDMVLILTLELGLPLKRGGSVALRRQLRRRGIEADSCFWIANAHRMAGRRRLDLRVDPPPDLAIEVDVTSSSLNRLAIYAALGVPEVWRARRQSTVLQRARSWAQVRHQPDQPGVSVGNARRPASLFAAGGAGRRCRTRSFCSSGTGSANDRLAILPRRRECRSFSLSCHPSTDLKQSPLSPWPSGRHAMLTAEGCRQRRLRFWERLEPARRAIISAWPIPFTSCTWPTSLSIPSASGPASAACCCSARTARPS